MFHEKKKKGEKSTENEKENRTYKVSISLSFISFPALELIEIDIVFFGDSGELK